MDHRTRKLMKMHKDLHPRDDKTDNMYQEMKGWLGGWVLWHINLCRLFSAKFILMQIVSSISNNSF